MQHRTQLNGNHSGITVYALDWCTYVWERMKKKKGKREIEKSFFAMSDDEAVLLF